MMRVPGAQVRAAPFGANLGSCKMVGKITLTLSADWKQRRQER